MATLVPLLRDILPMIMPSSIHIQKAPTVPPRPSSPPPHSMPGYPPISASPSSSSSHQHSQLPATSHPPLLPNDPTTLYNLPQPSPYDVPGPNPHYSAAESPNPFAEGYDGDGGYPGPYVRVGSPARAARVQVQVQDEGDLEGLDYSDGSGPPTPDYRNREIPGQSALRVTNQLVNRNDYMCASALELDARGHTSIRHHGEQETIIYIISGTLILSTKPDLEGEVVTNVISKGDFVCIPPWTEHQLRNDTDDPTAWLAMRNASVPITVDLVDWGEEEIEPLVTDSD